MKNHQFKIYTTYENSGSGKGDFITVMIGWEAVEDYCSRIPGHYYVTGPHDDMVTMLSYRSRFEWLIEREHISMYRLSARTGIAESTIQRYAYGVTNALKMPFENAYKIANALEMTIDELYEVLK